MPAATGGRAVSSGQTAAQLAMDVCYNTNSAAQQIYKAVTQGGSGEPTTHAYAGVPAACCMCCLHAVASCRALGAPNVGPLHLPAAAAADAASAMTQAYEQ